jgi:hypothetical protein
MARMGFMDSAGSRPGTRLSAGAAQAGGDGVRWYFAYGSNMARHRLEARIGPCQTGGHAWLDGYDLRFHKRGRDGSGKCDAYATGDASHRLHGVLFGICATQRAVLHEVEGPGYGVQRMTVTCERRVVEAFLYVARRQAIEDGLRPFDWYQAFVISGARQHDLPVHYVCRLARVVTARDPDRRRADENAAILLPPRSGAASVGVQMAGEPENR